MLTCYDFTTARLMARCGVDFLLAGDSAANVVFGHETTLPIEQDHLDALCAAVRRGHPAAWLVLDMAFGSYHGPDAVAAVCRSVKRSAADAVKLEVTAHHLPTIEALAAAGVAVVAHVGLTPQHVGRRGYRYAGRTPAEAARLVELCRSCEAAGASAILLEAVTAPATADVLAAAGVPVIGCGAGPRCAAYVVVTPDLLGLTDRRPRFVPHFDAADAPGGVRGQTEAVVRAYQRAVESADYPAAGHLYEMSE